MAFGRKDKAAPVETPEPVDTDFVDGITGPDAVDEPQEETSAPREIRHDTYPP